ncbi:DUF4352 domain-containing protein [Gordonia sp. (in: high G+C Gram-positive bacteria)]|uniref:DUF4352 domain-containing protein n=1 Tax=Gordonia sp. (in: high G+C Gram-positive bacteria) TaxID=84139 RepID=UPI003F96AB2D
MNESVSDGHGTEFSVTGVQSGVSSVGEFLTRTAKGTFALIEVTVTNASQRSTKVFANQQSAKDAAGRRYEVDTAASVSAGREFSWIAEINPGISTELTLVFDIPPTAELKTVSLRASGGRPVVVALV